MNKTICLLPGDGIGPEILAQGAAVLAATAQKFGHTFDSEEALIGGAAVDATGSPLPEATVEACRKADAVYLAAVGGPKWDSMPPEKRPEKGLLGIRKALGLFANLRPALLLPELAGACLLRPRVLISLWCASSRAMSISASRAAWNCAAVAARASIP